MKDIEERVLSDIEEAIRAEGRDEGEHIGETRGRAEGEANKAISIVKNLLKMGVNTMKQISEITGLSQEKLRELKATLLFSSPHTTKPLKLGLFLYGNFFPCTGFLWFLRRYGKGDKNPNKKGLTRSYKQKENKRWLPFQTDWFLEMVA